MTFIDPRAKVFRHADRIAAWQRGDKPAPVTVEWDVSNVCSLACQSCHFAHTHVAGPWAGHAAVPAEYSTTGRFADEHLVRRALGEMKAAGVRAVVWSGGGEPTLHPGFRSLVYAAAEVGLEQGLYTLGGHLTAGLAFEVAGLVRWAVVSLDAPDAETYAREKNVHANRFEHACQGIGAMAQAARHSGAVIGVSFLLHQSNWTRTGEMLALARKLGATYTTFRPAIETSPVSPSICTADRSWVTEAEAELVALSEETDVELDVDRFIEYRDWAGHQYPACHGIKLNTTVTPDGRVWVCPQRRGVSGSEIGDLRTESFTAIWARHPGTWTDFAGCRVMCRLNPVNQALAPAFTPQPHEAFV